MHEIELKYQVPAARRAAVDAAVAGRTPAPRQRLQAVYFDTAGRDLAQAGLALRIRREGRRRVQTLKGAGDDGMTRLEHEVALAQAGDDAVADPALHAGTPCGDALAKVLGKADAPALVPVFRTDVRRRARRVRTRQGVVELAFDEGGIVAGERRVPVCELEFELVSGSPLAIIDVARRWVLRHSLWLDTRSKAERGDLLARELAMAPARKSEDVELTDGTTWGGGRRAVLRSCLAQIAANGSQVADGTYDDEHVHQLRIGLRRLRTALRIFAGADTGELALQAAVLFRRFGAARDQAAVGGPLECELNEALTVAGLPFRAPPLPSTDPPADPTALMRLGPAQSVLLDLLALVQSDTSPPDAPALPEAIVACITRWHRRVDKLAKRFDTLADVERHTMRKRAKSLRYGIEFAQALFKSRDVGRYLKRLRALQDCLGVIVDTMVALDAYRAHSADDPHVLFALGWLAARRRELLREAKPAVKAFRKAEPFW
jgi:inorganic triphosphatase YgiF